MVVVVIVVVVVVVVVVVAVAVVSSEPHLPKPCTFLSWSRIAITLFSLLSNQLQPHYVRR